ncbi:uncharacterized protein N7482_001197 [Penicillium canariense]|uniref:Ankyrin repeat protein n=1 Tax=Penicillium canariense TaxID=189055 RepID=A0A9W9IDM1_9EURO|nr:uncharacterized protein N7482_001197 [Penicillium canariense]KAJ5175320.1 hypothetical protein N7482_001197 [Penicillium canariense]
MIETLLIWGADVNHVMTTWSIGSALAAACLGYRIENAKLLIRKGADVNMRLVCGEEGSALAAVCAKGQTAMADILLESGASINMPVTSGRYGSALAAACHRNSATMVDLLIDYGADVNMILENGDFPTSLMAAIHGRRGENVKVLLHKGANPNLSVPTGSFGDAISLAVHRKDKVSIRHLINAEARIGPLTADLIYTEGLCSPRFSNAHTSTHQKSVASPTSTNISCELLDLPRMYNDIQSALTNTTVLVRKKDTIEYSTVQKSLFDYYGTLGIDVMKGLVRTLKSSECLYTDGRMSLMAYSHGIRLTSCSLDQELLNILKWICLTVRRPVSGAIYLSAADSNLERFGPPSLTLRPLQPLHELDLPNGCWGELFDGAVVALAPGVQNKAPCRGLELNCNAMIQLAAVEYPVLVECGSDLPSGLVFLGYSTALIPIRETDDGMILWHLEVASQDRQIKASELQATRSDWLRTQDLSYLLSKKALLGWCSRAELRLGASTDDLNVTWSGAKVKPFSFELANINLQALAQSAAPAQLGMQVGASWQLVNNTVKFTPSGEYLKCLNRSRFDQIVLYDVSTMRAWLVPLIFVLHHMLLVYWKGIPEKFREADVPLAATASWHPYASYDALVDEGDVVIQRSEKSEDCLTVLKLLIGFSINLGRISRPKSKGKKIYGYEFMDIVHEPPTTTLKKTTLEKDSLAWSPLLNEINCLFCSDLGDAIVAQRTSELSSPCNTLPKGHDLMAALIRSIELLSETKGGWCGGHISPLLNDGAWQVTGSPFQECQHDTHESCWNQPEFLQKIKPLRLIERTSGSSLRDHINGAVVFGGPLKVRRFALSSRASGQYQSRQETIRVPIKQEQVENTTQMFVRSD